MEDQSRVGTNWSADELDAIVADHFAMLAQEVVGAFYVKAHHARDLMARTGRTHRSVEFKHMNISAVLTELGLPTIRGYKPKPNYQAAIFPAIDRYLSSNPHDFHSGAFQPRWVREVSPSAAALRFAEPPAIFVDDSPPPPGAPRPPRPEGLERLVRKFDPVARDFRNRSLGKAGEALIIDFERRRLEALDRKDLASKIRWVAQEDGDGAGYDIHSYDRQGNDRLIEVKTTQGARSTPFFVTRNELSLAHERPHHFRLYRLYEVAQAPRLFKLKPPLEETVTLEAETWRARIG